MIKYNFLGAPTEKEREVEKIFLNPANYKLETKLGQGAFGTVYLAVDKDGNEYAVKLFPVVSVNSQKYKVLYKEAYLTRSLDLKWTIKNYGLYYIKHEGKTYLGIVSDYYPGKKLEAYLRHCTDLLSERSLLFLMYQVMVAIKELHSHKIVHMDIKADNIIVSGKGIKLLDLGLACRFDNSPISQFNDCNYVKGPIPYISPEVWKANFSDLYEQDIWSYGVTFYYLLYRKLPFIVNTRNPMIVKTEMLEQQLKGPDYPAITNMKPVIFIIKKCLIYDYKDRFNSWQILTMLNREFELGA